MVIIDTSIIIDHLRRPPSESRLSQLLGQIPEENFGVSVVTIQELYEGKSTREKVKENQLLSILGTLQILPYKLETAIAAGKIARDSNDLIDLADAAIAATTIANGARLFTLNERHFRNIPDLLLVQP